jgi:photosystem II stability/assembly factor-like uncharacterized protein
MKNLISFMVALLTINGAIAQWTKLNPLPQSKSLSSIYFTNANTGYAVGDSGTILRTNDTGTTWTALSCGTIQNLYSVQFTDANTGFAVGETILKTNNGGTTWTDISGGTKHGISICFTDANTGYAVGGDWNIIKTTNGGSSWTDLSLFGNGGATSAYFTDANTGYMTSHYAFQGGIHKTIDGGTTWNFIGDKPPLYSIYFTDVNTGYAVGGYWTGNNSIIYKTTNGGSEWTLQYDALLHTLRSVYFPDANTGYAVGDFGTVLKTTNGGTDWTIQNSGTLHNLTSVYFTDANTGYAVGDSGTILKTTNGGGPLGVNNKAQILNSVNIYPNPVQDELHVNLEGNNGILEIRDISGKSFIQREIHENNTSIDVSGLDKGIYLVKVSSDNQIYTGKIVKY